ncbi:MAG: hypothetical protein QOD32_1761 [Pyrinomonadaceae bacterium]|jgi:hypothetical protein|nr:hypothetical protein [Pyrinomonadaceae bacterium]
MKQQVLRVVLTAAALLMVFAGSMNLDRAGASIPPGGGLCNDTCGCTPGSELCCSQGTITCYGKG